MSKKKNKDTLYGIIGLGRFGQALAESLAKAGKELIVIDNNQSKVNEATKFTENAFVVSELTKSNLEAIGLHNCDVVIVCVGKKIDVSILTTLTVVRLGIKKVISKATTEEQGSVLETLGAEVVYPERDMAIKLANKLVSPKILEYISLSNEIDIIEMKLPAKVNNLTVSKLDIRKKFGLNIIAIKHLDNINIEIDPDMVLFEDDIITVVGKKENIALFQKSIKS